MGHFWIAALATCILIGCKDDDCDPAMASCAPNSSSQVDAAASGTAQIAERCSKDEDCVAGAYCSETGGYYESPRLWGRCTARCNQSDRDCAQFEGADIGCMYDSCNVYCTNPGGLCRTGGYCNDAAGDRDWCGNDP